MADVENPGHHDEEEETMMAAEPRECSRLVCMVLILCVGCVLLVTSYGAIDSGNITAVTILGFLLSFAVLELFVILMAERDAGNREGMRIVDRLLQCS